MKPHRLIAVLARSVLLFVVSLLPTIALAATTERVSVDSNGVQGNHGSEYPAISSDGRYVAFESYADNLVPDDTNLANDIFVHDRQTGQTTRVSVDSNGVQGDYHSYHPSISSDDT